MLCLTPIMAINILLKSDLITDDKHIPQVIWQMSSLFWLMNSTFNPIIYTVFDRDFRHAFKCLIFYGK